MSERLPLVLMFLGLSLLVAGVATLFGPGWAMISAGGGLVALAANEAS